MLKLTFIRKVWERTEDSVLDLLSHFVIIISTILILCVIDHIIKILFPSEPEILIWIEMISLLCILSIVVLHAVAGVYRVYIENKGG